MIFIFRRDYRLNDNIGLLEAINYAEKHSLKIIPLFIINNHQVNGEYFSNRSFQFLAESLNDLNNQLDGKLVIYKGNNFLDHFKNIKAVFSNKDYTPYANERDNELESMCKSRNIECYFHDDYTLLPLDTISLNNDKKSFYKVFTPFYNKASSYEVPKTRLFHDRDKSFFTTKKSNAKLSDFYVKNESNAVQGGRTNAWKMLSENDHTKYIKTRNIPSLSSTTKMSAYLKYGCISIREFYWYIHKKYGKQHDLIRQLYWREFYAYITHHYPHVLKGMTTKDENGAFRTTAPRIKWTNKQIFFKAWCEGKTGFPIVDAGMRQMNETGFMHNRLRMVTSMFLTKHLHIDWRWGEKYFATKLIDYDPASNNGGWQWSAGTGTDYQNYFRMFNPWTQTKRFDPECVYIKKWIKELTNIPIDHILRWDSFYKEHSEVYIKPIVTHEIQRELTFTKIYNNNK